MMTKTRSWPPIHLRGVLAAAAFVAVCWMLLVSHDRPCTVVAAAQTAMDPTQAKKYDRQAIFEVRADAPSARASREMSPLLAMALDEHSKSHERVIIYVAGPDDGYGNRLPGLIWTFVWALLDRRVFLTEWRDDLTKQARAQIGDLFAPHLEFDADKLTVRKPWLRDARKIQSRQLFKELSTEALDAKFPDDVIRVSSDDWLYPLLAHNPHYRDRMARLFPHGRAFAHIAAFLLPLAPMLQAKVDTVKRHTLGRNTIGMHLRLQKMMPDNLGKKTLRAPSPDTFFRVARMIQRERGMSDNTTMFYLSTDSGSAVTAARVWFAQRNLAVVLFDDFYQIQRVDHKDAERGSLESLQNAIVEMRILSEMGELVGTLGSSFTQIAAAWGQLVPHNVMPDGSYWYSALSEPCFRYASRGHAVYIQDSHELVYHSRCSTSPSSSASVAFAPTQKAPGQKGSRGGTGGPQARRGR